MDTEVRATASEREAEEWALVLAAAQIPHRLEPAETGWLLLVPAPDAGRAREALDAFDEEAQAEEAAPVPAPLPTPVPWSAGVPVAAVLLAFFAFTGPPAAGSPWFARGAAAAEALLSGEPWRAVTAIMLHVDGAHVAGNALATAVLLPAIVHRVGLGVALWLLLAAGAGANTLAALAHDPGHVAVGASGATFGALGILGALRMLPGASGARPRWKAWTIPVAGLLLLALLGTAQGADVLAHAFGFVTGVALGLAAALLPRPPGRTVQSALVAAAALTVAACWHLALAGASRMV